ncbi:hypothetical protein [Cupriavidus basilensis]|uniref:hypothetical protein n=1 Tax=Cupriavidus basilensis TaxID=68895 RepID=UPI001246AA2E|nr:hypothetical protein [Cupriavidus basilensis]MCP3022871.1 hypothetical protein [Cupriavidus basilensis]
MKTLENSDEIVGDAFGLWISSLFSAIGGRNPGFSFDEQRDAFFWLIEDLLVKGRIKFISPGADCYVSQGNPEPKLTIDDPASHWKASPKEIVDFLREKWPVNVSSENDVDLTMYFYEVPGLIWVASDGSLVAS